MPVRDAVTKTINERMCKSNWIAPAQWNRKHYDHQLRVTNACQPGSRVVQASMSLVTRHNVGLGTTKMEAEERVYC
jgi:hypothetical protein